MGLLDKLKGEFVDIIEWKDDSRDTLVWRFPRYQDEIKNGAQLTVRESQLAILVNEGQIADIYSPGRHVLATQNMPILSTLKGWKFGFNSPFKVDVYFVNTKQFPDQKWGTSNPISLRDSEYGEVDIRSFGTYAYRCPDVDSARKLLQEIVGTNKHFSVEDINGQLRSMLVASFTDAVGESRVAFIDMAANLDELSAAVRGRIAKDFEEYGLKLTKFVIQNVSVPEEIQEIRKQRMKMKMLGVANYQQLAAADAMLAAANNPSGGAAGVGVGVGAGYMMGQQMMGAFAQPQQQQQAQAAPPPLPQQAQYFAAVGGAQAGPFDLGALRQQIGSGSITRDTLVWKQGMAAWTKAGEVAEVASLFGAAPPPLPPPLPG
jgi:membrane protease subunit (stomatin/prohibitin family)